MNIIFIIVYYSIKKNQNKQEREQKYKNNTTN